MNRRSQLPTAVRTPSLAVIEATEEAVYNSMFKATTMTGNGHTVEALPIEKTMGILKEHRVIK
jgi:D-aminopeptidase